MDEQPHIEVIVLGHDGSVGGATAAAWAAPLASQLGARVVVVRAYNPIDDLGTSSATDLASVELIARRRLEDEWSKPFRDAGVACRAELIEDNDAAAVIARIARAEHADLVVVGSHGETGWRERILGSVPTRLPHESPCPVVIVPQSPPG